MTITVPCPHCGELVTIDLETDTINIQPPKDWTERIQERGEDTP